MESTATTSNEQFQINRTDMNLDDTHLDQTDHYEPTAKRGRGKEYKIECTFNTLIEAKNIK